MHRLHLPIRHSLCGRRRAPAATTDAGPPVWSPSPQPLALRSPRPPFTFPCVSSLLVLVDSSGATYPVSGFPYYDRLREVTVDCSLQICRASAFAPTTCYRRPIDHSRSWLIAVALLRFDFDYGDLVRWLGGEYTNAHRDWADAFQQVGAVRHCKVPPGYPPVDFDCAYRACTEGVPSAGIYECSARATWQRERYDNHAPLADETAAVREKLGKEEQNSFFILLPRFLAYFIFGLHISPLSMVWRKGKGRVCVANSSTLDQNDDGAPNNSIPAPGTADRDDECPSVHYASAFKRPITWIWNLRISSPFADILQFGDDVHAAFHRMLYHPDIAIVFAFVFAEFLCIPVGSVFGARNSPSWWCILAAIRAHFAACGDFSGKPPLLAARVELVPEPSPREQRRLKQAQPDPCHQGVPACPAGRHHQTMFVDDSAQAALREFILPSIHASEQSSRHRPPHILPFR
jgi:hypothetical protein